jgi:voltage-gated potassium channel
MRTPLQRIRFGAVSLVSVFLISVCSYHFLGDYTWLEAVWLVVVTISTVGFSETTESSPVLQLVTIAVIVTGVSSGVYACGGFIQLVLEGEVERALGKRKMINDINRLKEHVVICGFGRLGLDLAVQLQHRRIPFVVIDQDTEKVESAKERNILAIHGDATAEEVIEQANLANAKALVTAPALGCGKRVYHADRAEPPSGNSDHRQVRTGKQLPQTATGRRRQDRDAAPRRRPSKWNA